jgi:hypothetical protein
VQKAENESDINVSERFRFLMLFGFIVNSFFSILFLVGIINGYIALSKEVMSE